MGTLRGNQPTATLTAPMLHNLAFLCVVGYASAGLVHYPNGAVVPVDPASQVATAAHLAAKAYASPYYHTGYHYLGKREVDADADASLVHYHNGAVVPVDPANQVATAAHLAAEAYASPYYHAGYHYLGKREADADADASLVTYPNGAVVPYNPYLHGVGSHYAYGYLHGRKRREAEAEADPFVLYNAYNFGYLPYVQPLVAHPNGAVVPLEPASVVKARADHLATKYGA